MTIYQVSRRVERIEAGAVRAKDMKKKRARVEAIEKKAERPLQNATKCPCCGFTILDVCPSCGPQEIL